MELSSKKRGVGLFGDRDQVELALSKLKSSGFPMNQVEIIVRNAEGEQKIQGIDVRDHRGNHSKDGAITGLLAGGAIGSLTGLLVGLGLLAIPGIGPILLAGAEATAIATTLAGGTIGGVTGGLCGALIGLGIPQSRVKIYQDGILKGDYLIVVEGTESELLEAQEILDRYDIEEWNIYQASDRNQAKVNHQYNLNGTTINQEKPLVEAENIARVDNYNPSTIDHQLDLDPIITKKEEPKADLDVENIARVDNYNPSTIDHQLDLDTNTFNSEHELVNVNDNTTESLTQQNLINYRNIDNALDHSQINFEKIQSKTESLNPITSKASVLESFASKEKIINSKPKVILVDLRN